MTLGITTDSNSLGGIICGADYKTLALPIKASEGAIAVGQVLEYDATSHAYKKRTSGVSACAYAIALEAATVTTSVNLLCLVYGEVRANGIDAINQADPDTAAALLGSGIMLRNQIVL